MKQISAHAVDFVTFLCYTVQNYRTGSVDMANIKDNRRSQYTRTALRRALLMLMLKKPVDKITVKELCDEADINRGTFYVHYASPEQLLAQVENEFYLDLLAEVTSFREADDVERIFVDALRALYERRELASALFGPNGDREFLNRVVRVAHDICIVQWSGVSPETGRELLEKLYSFIAFGVAHLLQDWLASGAKDSPERMAAILTDFCNFGVSSCVELDRIVPPVGRRLKRAE